MAAARQGGSRRPAFNEPLVTWMCPECNTPADGDAEVCAKCGFNLKTWTAPKAPPAEKKAASPRPPANEPAAARVCPGCQAPCPGDAEVCAKCGVNLKTGTAPKAPPAEKEATSPAPSAGGPAATRVCPGCQAQCPGDAEVCSECGLDLKRWVAPEGAATTGVGEGATARAPAVPRVIRLAHVGIGLALAVVLSTVAMLCISHFASGFLFVTAAVAWLGAAVVLGALYPVLRPFPRKRVDSEVSDSLRERWLVAQALAVLSLVLGALALAFGGHERQAEPGAAGTCRTAAEETLQRFLKEMESREPNGLRGASAAVRLPDLADSDDKAVFWTEQWRKRFGRHRDVNWLSGGDNPSAIVLFSVRFEKVRDVLFNIWPAEAGQWAVDVGPALDRLERAARNEWREFERKQREAAGAAEEPAGNAK
ncbi:MAG: hypothetical protein NTW87_18535 [Planctomycetota bacterium]|nr:hypothetical protein [Planctomycetota bacterium]